MSPPFFVGDGLDSEFVAASDFGALVSAFAGDDSAFDDASDPPLFDSPAPPLESTPPES